MRFQLTPAAERALSAAAAWASCADRNELHVPEVLLGLLAEPECRSALLLAPYGIDTAAVRRRFVHLAPVEPADPQRATRFSSETLACFNAAENLLIDYPRPLVLATEHLLLGITATSNEVAAWLAECGLYADALEAEVHRLAGHQPGPLPLDTSEDATAWVNVDEPDSNPESRGEPTPQDQLATLRILDAAANRAGEGLRVIEDYLRFVLDDRHLTAHCKSIRHELAAALQFFSAAERHAARETLSDVGTQVTLDAEQTRGDTAAVLQANFKRVEQALRSLEEFSKTRSPEVAASLEQLRYRVYTLERAVDITRSSLQRLAEARLYVLVDGRASAEGFEAMVESLVAAGVSAIQLRDKQLADRELLGRARLLRQATQGTQALFIMNDRPDLAVLSGADGVHVGQDELTVKDARRILGPSGLIGVSTHSLQQARAAVLDGADYLGVGPTFPSDTKSFSEFTGLELLRAVQAEIRLPAFAIGGITADNLPQVLATGFTRVAVGSAIADAKDPAAAVRQFLAAFGHPETHEGRVAPGY